MNQQDIQDKLNRHLSFLEQDENNLALLLEVSEMYHQLEDLDTAQTYLNKASSIDRVACLGQQGLLNLNLGLVEEAKSNFVEALSYSEIIPIRYNLAFIYLFSKELEAAEETLSPLLTQEDQPEAKLLFARLLHLQYQLDEAIDWVNQVLNQNPKNTDALGLLALLYFDNNQEQLAHTTAQETLIMDPENYDARIVDILTRLITQSTTADEILDLIEKIPQDSRLWFALGNTYLSAGNIESAIESLEHAVSINPNFYDCMILLAWCHLFSDNLEIAETIYEEASILAPELADAWGGMALINALKEDLTAAEELLAKSRDLNPECFLSEMAEVIYYTHKNPSKAQKQLISTLQSTHTPASEKLALVLEGYSSQLH